MLEEIQNWVNNKSGTNILWLHGPAGAGKSAIAQTIAERSAEHGQLAASFFFARTRHYCNEKQFLFPTVAVQVAAGSQDRRDKLSSIISGDPLLLTRQGGAVQLLARFVNDPDVTTYLTSSFLVVIDGLDECLNREDQVRILLEMLELITKHRTLLRFLVVSRPEAWIKDAFDDPRLANLTKSVSFYGDHQAHADIAAYLRVEFQRICQSRKHCESMRFIKEEWPSPEIVNALVYKSGGYFIYPSTVIRFVDDEDYDCTERLDQVMGIKNPYDSDTRPFAELDNLYSGILSSYSPSQLPLLKHILGFLSICGGSSITIKLIAISLPNLREGRIWQMMRGLRSLVYIVSEQPIAFHLSFVDFLRDPDRAGRFYVVPDEWCEVIFRHCFTTECISRRLMRHPVTDLRYEPISPD